jgi:hypothetical protein
MVKPILGMLSDKWFVVVMEGRRQVASADENACIDAAITQARQLQSPSAGECFT